jgi:hypothetical protein
VTARKTKQIPSMEDLGIRRKVPVFLGEGDERIQIGEADVQQAANGGLILDMYLAGMWTDPAIMSECLQMKGFISEGQRKD